MSQESAVRTLRHEANAILRLAENLPKGFETAVDWIVNCRGRVLTAGVGKSGHIARKTAGTLSSTGTLSGFLHASEAVHGDLGMVSEGDIVLLYTHSGETDEIVRLFPHFRAQGARSILITGRPESSAGRAADLVLDTHVTEEACPIKLAPTTSTTVMLALSDALALAVMEAKGFTAEDFAKFHPRGTLGKRLLLTVAEAMRPLDDIAIVAPTAEVLEVTKAITQAGVGAACVIESGKLVGFISDGDIRRVIASGIPLDSPASSYMSSVFTTIQPDLLAVEALEFFQNLPKKLGELPVVQEGELLGLLMLKDLLRSGIL